MTGSPLPPDDALARIGAICRAFPEAEETPGGFPSWKVRGKQFAQFSENHHNDGVIALQCAGTVLAQQELIAMDPAVFFSPAYVGHRGWVGLRVDRPVDWERLIEVVATGYRHAAPKTLAARVDVGAVKAAFAKADAAPPLPPRPIDTESPKRLERIRRVALALPETEEATSFGSPCFKVRGKTFVRWVPNSHGLQTPHAELKLTLEMQAMLADVQPAAFFVPAYSGPSGWVGVRVGEASLDWAQLEDLVREAYLNAAPRRLADRLEAGR